ncbi:MAG: bifunctional heptose 7-phosphate kinase/heptose 1-phosphate adenyltransferase [Bacillota bacterium]
MTNYSKYEKISYRRLKELLARLDRVTATVIGDGVLDIYWEADMTRSRLSRETPHYPLPVVKERLSGGGGANVAANLAALNLERVGLLTVVGEDWRGRELKDLLKKQGITLDYVVESSDWTTPAYCKPIRHGLSEISYEDPRLDFKNYKKLPSAIERQMLELVTEVIERETGVAVADQLENGIITERIRKEINRVSLSRLVTVDSRSQIAHFKNAILKPNQIEAVRAVYPQPNPAETDFEDWKQAGIELSRKQESPVLLTMGSRGALWIEGGEKLIEVPAIPAQKPIDIVGAGDSFMATFIAIRAAGASPKEAISIANLAAGVVVKKLRTTGTATRGEIKQRYQQIYGG